MFGGNRKFGMLAAHSRPAASAPNKTIQGQIHFPMDIPKEVVIPLRRAKDDYG